MGAKAWLMMLGLLLMSRAAEARLFLLWDYERTFIPPGDTVPVPEFVLTIDSLAGIPGQQQLIVPATPRGACASLPGADADTFCAEVRCPGPGTYAMQVEARWPRSQIVSPPSNTITDQILDNAPCTIVPITPGSVATVSPQTLPPQPTVGPPASPCASAASTPTLLPTPTTTTQPAPLTLTVSAPAPQSPPPPIAPRLPTQVRTIASVIVPRVAPAPVIAAGSSGPVASSTVYAGPPTQVPLTQTTVPPYTSTPCP